MPKPVDVKTPSDREVVVTRAFDAPRQLVWDAHTQPELLKRWIRSCHISTMSCTGKSLRA